jgi:hypothetical protein
LSDFNYAEARLSLKILITCFLVCIGISYIFGLVNIYNNTGMSYTGLVVHYRGDAKEMTLPAEFAFSKLIQEHHVHLFGLSIIFLIIGFLFSLTSLPEPVKAPFVAAPFIGMFLDFAGLWSTVFVSAAFGWLSIIFGALMALSFFMLVGRPLYEMWALPAVKDMLGDNTPWFLR